MRWTVVVDSPVASAITRAVHRAASAGVVLSDRSMTSAACSLVSGGPKPSQGLLKSPQIPSSRKHCCHRSTVLRPTPKSLATSSSVSPSAQRRIMRQRSDLAPVPRRPQVRLFNDSRSSSSRTTAGRVLTRPSLTRSIAVPPKPRARRYPRFAFLLSSNPSMRSLRNLARHSLTVLELRPISFAIAPLLRPSAHRKIMRQRAAMALVVSRSRKQFSRANRSSRSS